LSPNHGVNAVDSSWDNSLILRQCWLAARCLKDGHTAAVGYGLGTAAENILDITTVFIFAAPLPILASPMHPVLHSSCSTPVPYVSGLTALEIDTSVRAGFPSPAEDFQAERIDVLKHIILHPQATYTLRVRGDSMRDEGRSVDVPWSLMEDMWVYLLHQRELRRQRSGLSPSALVLTGLGNEFSKGGVVDAMKAIEKKVGFPVRAHMLRHTYTWRYPYDSRRRGRASIFASKRRLFGSEGLCSDCIGSIWKWPGSYPTKSYRLARLARSLE